ILNQIACKMLDATSHIVPNWLISSPDPNVSIGQACEPFKVEMVVRGYLSGHAARLYKSGERKICGVVMPDGMIENDKFINPILTPTTKADNGSHDEDISREEILLNNIVNEEDYLKLEDYSLKLFEEGSRIAKNQGLILVDTKYEFGKNKSGQIILIDEIHTPDSSRYFYLDSYLELQNSKLPQKQLSKEFVRQWLISNGFQGKENQIIPEMSNDYIKGVSNRYIELYEKITGLEFVKEELNRIDKRIETNILNYFDV
ncbi:MAG: phosphoribosylaminoimidazolesuccinocarboxamide synthase, partial [Flavobacteriaceae bacterium]|nr:phosphoribosylaminoimidazolesuccinocarboxamide synthase [Flavobacteriaceae bacterium]